jgi:hypothetical protein
MPMMWRLWGVVKELENRVGNRVLQNGFDCGFGNELQVGVVAIQTSVTNQCHDIGDTSIPSSGGPEGMARLRRDKGAIPSQHTQYEDAEPDKPDALSDSLEGDGFAS